MKKTKYLPLLAVSLLLVACGGEVSSVAPSSVEPSSEAPTSVVEPSSEAPSSEEPKEVVLNLDGLKLGYRARSSYAKKVLYNPTAVPDEYKYDSLVEVYLNPTVVKTVTYSGSSWETATRSVVKQYQLSSDNKVVRPTVNLAGEVTLNPTNFMDPVLGADPDIAWTDANLENAFLDLEASDFTKQEDGTYALNIETIKQGDNSEKKGALTRLANQVFLKATESMSGDYFTKGSLKSYTLTVNEEGVPVSYECEFEMQQQDDGWGGYDYLHQAAKGTFEEFGDELVSPVSSYEKKYEELDNTLAELSKHNYYVNAFASYDSWSGTGVSYSANIRSTGTSLETTVTTYDYSQTPTTVTTGYKQVENTYRKYSFENGVATFAEDAVEGTIVEDLLPNFSLMTSALFVKDESSDDSVSVYRLVIPELFETITGPTIFNNFGDSGIAPVYPSINNFVIMVSPQYVTFKNSGPDTSFTFDFYNIGYSKINTVVNEPAAAE